MYYSPLFDIEGKQRPEPYGSMPDMGAYENALGEPIYGIGPQPNHENFIINYPNPFRDMTTIKYCTTRLLPTDRDTPWQASLHDFSQINIFNVEGQLVRELRPFTTSPSRFLEVTWDGRDDTGKEVKPGIYFYTLSINGKTEAVEKCLFIQ